MLDPGYAPGHIGSKKCYQAYVDGRPVGMSRKTHSPVASCMAAADWKAKPPLMLSPGRMDEFINNPGNLLGSFDHRIMADILEVSTGNDTRKLNLPLLVRFEAHLA